MPEQEGEKFGELMSRYLSSDLDEKSLNEFTRLLHTDNTSKKKYNRAVKQHARLLLPRFEQHKEDNYAKLSRQLGFEHPKRRALTLPWKVLAIASVILLLLTTTLTVHFYTHTPDTDEQYAQMLVPPGSQAKVVMPDGTLVHLNSGSQLRYSLTPGSTERKVYLNGEAYFEVAKDQDCPFIVHTSRLDVKVLGTEFNVKSYPEDPTIEVSLVGGKVDVSAIGIDNGTQLSPDECYVFNKADNTYRVKQVDALLAMAWTTGKITFVNQTLLDIVRDLERRKDVRIVVRTEKLKNEYFSGSIRADYTLDEALNFLDVDKKYRWERLGNTITIRDK